jgi:transposase
VDCEVCGVRQERLEFLASNTKFTKRLALSIGGLCRTMPVNDVAKRMGLDWHTVKEIDKEYMREQLARAGPPSPSVIGIDEIGIKKRHTYRIEPPRVCRRPFRLSHAAMACSSICA